MMGKTQVLDYLSTEGIQFELREHPPVYTMEEMRELGLHHYGEMCKNLFLRDAKGKIHILVVMKETREADLKKLSERLGIPKLSFASPERLMKYLGLQKGAVSPLGILNDSEKAVRVIFDRELDGKKRLGVHPNDNRATVFLKYEDLKGLIEKHGNEFQVMSL